MVAMGGGFVVVSIWTACMIGEGIGAQGLEQVVIGVGIGWYLGVEGLVSSLSRWAAHLPRRPFIASAWTSDAASASCAHWSPHGAPSLSQAVYLYPHGP